MLNTVYSYGGGEALVVIFNAIAMLFSNGVSKSIITLMTTVALTWAGVVSAIQGHFKPQVHWVIRYTIVIGLLITPQSSIWVRDIINMKAKKIDNIPIGLALPAGIISGVGYAITTAFESVFNTVDYLPYHKYGTVFGAQMMSEARNFKIQDPVFRENMESFIDNCVMHDVMIGRKYSIKDLRNSSSVWQLISDNSSNIKMFNYRNGTSGRNLVTCREGVKSLAAQWNAEYLAVEKRLPIIKHFVEQKSGVDSLFSSNIEAVMSFYGSKQTAAQDVLRQLLMINAISDLPQSYGAIRATQQQKQSWILAGELAKQNLPIMHSVFEALIYAAFPLIFGLMFLPGGFKLAGTYFGMMMWIQVWPPLFAVLNLIVNSFNKSVVKDIIVDGLTMENVVSISNSGSLAAAAAGGLGMFIPVISYMIIKGGVSQFVHIAGQLSAASQTATSAVSNEVTSGNRSFDNVSLSAQSYMNSSGFKQDFNSVVKSGHSEYSLQDGTIVREMPGGHAITQSGPGITTSAGSKSFRHSDMLSGQSHKQLSHEKSLLDSTSREYSDSQQLVHRQAADLISRLAQGESSGEHYDYSTSGGKTQIVTELVGQTKELHEKYGYNWQQAAEASLFGSLVAKLGFSKGAGGGGASGGIDGSFGVSGSISARKYDEQGLGEQYGASQRKESSINTEAVVKGLNSIQFGTNQSAEKSLAHQLSDSYDKTLQLRESVAIHKQNVDKYQDSLDRVESTSHSIDRDEYQNMINFISAEPGKYGNPIGPVNAHKIIEGGGEEFNSYYKSYISQKVSGSEFMRDPHYFKNNADFKNKAVEGKIDEISSDISASKVTDSFMQQSKQIQEVSRGGKYQTEYTIPKSQDYFDEVRQGNTEKFDNLQHKVDEAEAQESVHKTIKKWQGKQKKFADAD
jgi:conjugal transfer mating pair stabilization protein TraG